jgi:parvulin-like peptidyl-prolyl isomerase
MRLHSLFALMAFVSYSAVYAQGQTVASVNNSKITLKDFQAKYNAVKKESINAPPPELFLEDLVRFEMGAQEAEKLKLDQDPVVKENMRREMYKGLLERELGKQVDAINVSENEMKEFYKKFPEIRSSHILIEFPADPTDAQRDAALKRADEILKEVKSSKRPFEELVKLYSDDNLSKMNGGDIGFQSRVTVVPPYYDLLMKLKPNEVGGPVRTLYGFHIVKVTGRRTYQDANKRQIRAAVFDEKRKVIFDKYFGKLRSKYKITKDENLIKSLK